MSQIGNVGVKKNAGAIVGIQPSIDFTEGTNITLTIANDPANHDVSVTIDVDAGAAAQDIFYEAPNPDDYKGYYASMLLVDGVSTTIRQTFYLPLSYDSETWGVYVLVIPDADGDLRWGIDTNFGTPCTEEFDAHTGTIALGQTTVQNDDIECLDIATGLAGAVAGDLVGMTFVRDGGDGLDTVDDEVHYIGVLLLAPGEL